MLTVTPEVFVEIEKFLYMPPEDLAFMLEIPEQALELLRTDEECCTMAITEKLHDLVLEESVIEPMKRRSTAVQLFLDSFPVSTLPRRGSAGI